MKKKTHNDDSLNVKSRRKAAKKIINLNNNGKSLFELSLPLMISFWFLLLLFYSKFGLTNGNGGNIHTYNRSTSNSYNRSTSNSYNRSTSNSYNRSMSNSSVSCGKFSNSAYPFVENGDKNQTNGFILEVNVSMIFNDSTVHDHHRANPEYSLKETSALEEVVWNILGYGDLMCEMQPHEVYKKEKTEQLQNRRKAYLNLDEFRNITKQEKGSTPNRLDNITHRLEPDGTEYNYASASKGAKVVAHNKEAKGATNILGKDHDKYLRNPCSVVGKFVVIELAEETLVDAVKIANFEHYSSNFKQFELSGSLTYPTETWYPLGNFVAANVKHAQSFKLPEPKWVRYLKLNLLSHYGSEFYCTLSLVEVYGDDAIERMLEDLIVKSDESATAKLPKPNSTAMPSLIPEPGVSDGKADNEIRDTVDAASKGVEKTEVDDGSKLNSNAPKIQVTVSSIPDPIVKVRQQSNGRIHGDAVLKILMQKVRSLELNLSVLEEYIKELNKRQADVLPELDKEFLRYSTLLEKSRAEIKELLEWKEIMEEGISDIESWKSMVSSQLDKLVRENVMLRLDVEKVASQQAYLEKKELTVLAVSFAVAFFAILKLVSDFSGASLTDLVCWTHRGCEMIIFSCGIVVFIGLVIS